MIRLGGGWCLGGGCFLLIGFFIRILGAFYVYWLFMDDGWFTFLVFGVGLYVGFTPTHLFKAHAFRYL